MKKPPSLAASVFGHDFKKAREAAGLTQEQIREKTGIAISYISGIENGTRNITFKKAEALAAAVSKRLTILLSD